jgi:predicted Zn finger-like uncharacterized protein
MIISCDQCHKKFEIDSNLIPKDGRLLECGSCKHKWFYKQNIEDKTEEITIAPQLKNIEEENIEEENINPIETNISQINELDTSPEKKEIVENKKISILNIIIVFIISFVALIILIETFKDPISIFIPNIKLILNSLYETLNDIVLFFKDLIK